MDGIYQFSIHLQHLRNELFVFAWPGVEGLGYFNQGKGRTHRMNVDSAVLTARFCAPKGHLAFWVGTYHGDLVARVAEDFWFLDPETVEQGLELLIVDSFNLHFYLI
jgi:hypothetical protein